MDRHDRSRRSIPTVEALENRRLPSYFGSWGSSSYYNQVSYQARIVRHEYDQYVGELKRLELASRATSAEYLALRDDARAIAAAASGSGSKLPVADVQLKAVSASLELDRAPLYGWLGNAGWAGEKARLSGYLGGLGIPAPLVDQTISDMRALAVSAGVGPDGFATISDDFNNLRNGEQSLPSNSGYHFEDPSLYYTQHLRGFFRDWGVKKIHARAQLDRDLAAVRHVSGTSPRGAAVLQRDAQILEGVGAAVPSTTMNQFNAAYVGAFAQGPPSSSNLPALRTTLLGILGPSLSGPQAASVGRLVSDAPAFYQAAGSSQADVQSIVADVGALVDAGGGSTLNPFRITIQPG